jgi:hypothetical protein
VAEHAGLRPGPPPRLAANELALAVSPVFSPGVNLVEAVFLDPELRHSFHDWDDLCRAAVARLRALVGPDEDDPRLVELVGELTLDHPLVGPVQLKPERFAIIGTVAQVLVVRHAERGSASERALQQLAEIVAGQPQR